jgi:hypothetical protein
LNLFLEIIENPLEEIIHFRNRHDLKLAIGGRSDYRNLAETGVLCDVLCRNPEMEDGQSLSRPFLHSDASPADCKN